MNINDFKRKLNMVYRPSFIPLFTVIVISWVIYNFLFNVLPELNWVVSIFVIFIWIVIVYNILSVIVPRYVILHLFKKDQEAMVQYMKKRYEKEIKGITIEALEDNKRLIAYKDLLEMLETNAQVNE